MTFIDQMNNEIILNDFPKRIISLVPSQTELLYHFGLNEKVVGITKFCIHPDEWYKSKVRVGGTKNLHLNIISDLKPDLIIGNKEENEKEQIQELMKLYPVWISNIKTLEEAMEMILAIGQITDKVPIAVDVCKKIQIAFDSLKKLDHPTNVAYFIWWNPHMVVGKNTFINDILMRCGFNNIFESLGRYPKIAEKQLKSFNPKIILLSSEPYPFKNKHIEELKIICPESHIELVDGEMFSWYGSRLLHSADYLCKLIQKINSLQNR